MITLSVSFANANDEPKPEVKGMTPFFPQQIYGEMQKSAKAPDGMITAIREKGSWKFRILSSESGWNTGSGINKAILKGDGFMLPIKLSGTATLRDLNSIYTDIVLSDEMVKSASLELHWSSFGQTGSKSVLYNLKLSELVK